MHPFIQNYALTDLGFGSGFALWGFRAIATGAPQPCCLTTGFNRAFAIDSAQAKSQHGGTDGRLAINALKSFVCQIDQGGRRTISLAQSGTIRVTADEICIAGALAAAQNGNDALCHAHLSWLLGSTQTRLAHIAAVTYGQLCTARGIMMDYPDADISVTQDMGSAPQFTRSSSTLPPNCRAQPLSQWL